ncbi:MAG: NADH-quinone oxidoreductase subunit L, partial [Rhizobium rhizophilum]
MMLVPLGLLAVGAIFSGVVFMKKFTDEAGIKGFFRDSIFMRPENHIIHDFHSVPGWVPWTPFVMMAIGFALAWYMYIKRPDVPAKLAREHQGLYQFLLNKWYFDELYDRIF